MNRRFLNAGKTFNDNKIKQDKISVAVTTLQWLNLPVANLPFSQGFALKEIIKQMGNNPDKVGYGIFNEGIALLAMRNNYSKGQVRRATLYAVDTGVEVISVAVDEETLEDLVNENHPQPTQTKNA